MKQHIAGAGPIGARVIADNGVESECRLDGIRFEPAVEPFPCRLAEQREEIAFGDGVEPPELLCNAAGPDQFAERVGPAHLDCLRGRNQQKFAYRVGEHGKPRREGVEALGVTARIFRHFAFGAAAPDREIFALVQRQEVLHLPVDDGEPVLGQRHLGDDFRMKERDRVARGRIPETGREFFRDRRAADDAAPLKHKRFETRARAIKGADEAVMPAADDDDVVLFRRQSRLYGRRCCGNGYRPLDCW